jgi:glycerol-3-phosphate acyltransferase PlsX
VVKSHGGTDAQGFAHAVDVAMDMVVHRFNDRIREDLSKLALDKRIAADKRDRGPGATGIVDGSLADHTRTSESQSGDPRPDSTDDTHFATA